MRVRPAASSAPLSEMMEKVVEIPDFDALMAYLQEHYSFWNPTKENVTIDRYGYDDRIGWDTHIICVAGKAALFSDGSLPKDNFVSPSSSGPIQSIDSIPN